MCFPGLYRLCGSATKKRILRESFERNSRTVELTPDNVPDINVITGVLKDYLRELPQPLFTKCLYQMTVDALGKLLKIYHFNYYTCRVIRMWHVYTRAETELAIGDPTTNTVGLILGPALITV